MAFVCGLVARATDRATSDIDLMTISDALSDGRYVRRTRADHACRGTDGESTACTVAEFSRWAREGSAFVTRAMEHLKPWVIGTEEALTVFV